jgi:hypothetical protein
MSEDAAHQTMEGEASAPPSPEDLSARMLVVLIGCSDGKLRTVAFEGRQAKQVHGYLRHIQGGHLQLKTEPLTLLLESEAVSLAQRATENAERPTPEAEPRSLLGRLCRLAYFRSPNSEIRNPQCSK